MPGKAALEGCGVGRIFQQGLRYEKCVFRIVADHASAKQKAMPPMAG
jgi:hypothetical protein